MQNINNSGVHENSLPHFLLQVAKRVRHKKQKENTTVCYKIFLFVGYHVKLANKSRLSYYLHIYFQNE